MTQEKRKLANGEAEEREAKVAKAAAAAREFDLLFCGSTKWSSMRRGSVPMRVKRSGGGDAGVQVYAPNRLRFPALAAVNFRHVYSGPCAAHAILIAADGAAYGIGRNEHGQLGAPEPLAVPVPMKVDVKLREGEKFVSAACGRAHTILVTSEGRSFAAGANGFGQLGTGTRHEMVCEWKPVKIRKGERVVGASAGGNFTIWVLESGIVCSSGSAQYGQLGTGLTGECLEKANTISFAKADEPIRIHAFDDTKVVAVASGVNHSLALDEQGRVWSWGWGAYGRLGHKTTKEHRSTDDVLSPKIIDALANSGMKVDMIMCGERASWAYIGERKVTYRWGIWKPTGDAQMYPVIEHDLTGWEVRSFTAGPTSCFIAAETSAISSGCSPAYGELGYGDNEKKSSTSLKKVDALEDLVTEQVAMGQAFTFLIVDVTNNEHRKIVDELDELEIEE